MFAKFSYENRIQEKLRTLRCTADCLSAVAQVPASRLSHAFRGVRPLSNADGEMFLDILKEMEALVESVAPIPVSFRNPEIIRDVLKVRGASNSVAAAT